MFTSAPITFFLAALLVCSSALSQVVIGESEGTPDPSAILDLQSSSKGLLPPRLTESERNAIENPVAGLTIFNTTSNCTNVYNGSNWFELCGTCTPPAPSGLSYDQNGPLVYCLDEAITANHPETSTGTPTSYTISPSPPQGLLLNATTGALSGTPLSVSPQTNYTITASNSCGSTTRILSITVSEYLAPLSDVSGPQAPTTGVGNAVYSITPVSGDVTYNWSVPAGWFILSGSGTHTILVNPGSSAGNVSVSVSNPCSTVSSQLAVNPWRPLVATGGNSVNDITSGGVTYRVHSFTNVGSSSLNITDAGTIGTVQYLVIGGGGGGGGNTHSQNGSGGGGAGGYRCSVPGEPSGGGASAESPLAVTTGNLSVTVGGGGLGQGASGLGRGANGGNSSLGSIVALGGGGGSGSQEAATSGGSGGAGDSYNLNAAGNAARIGASGTTGQGFAGGNGNDNSGGGGGGGAGSSGNAAAGGVGGNGGSGVASSITGTSVTRAGGGGGGSWNAATPGQGGAGGGGNAGGQSSPPQAGAANTGSGGGASKSGYNGGTGGSGIVIVRYPITNPNP